MEKTSSAFMTQNTIFSENTITTNLDINNKKITNVSHDFNDTNIESIPSSRALSNAVSEVLSSINEIDPNNILFTDNFAISLPLIEPTLLENKEKCIYHNWKLGEKSIIYNGSQKTNYVKILPKTFTHKGTYFLEITIKVLNSGSIVIRDTVNEENSIIATISAPGQYSYEFNIPNPDAHTLIIEAINVNKTEIIEISSVYLYFITNRFKKYINYFKYKLLHEESTLSGKFSQLEIKFNQLQASLLEKTNAISATLSNHINISSNPHNITPELIGAANKVHTHTPDECGAAPEVHTHMASECNAPSMDIFTAANNKQKQNTEEINSLKESTAGLPSLTTTVNETKLLATDAKHIADLANTSATSASEKATKASTDATVANDLSTSLANQYTNLELSVSSVSTTADTAKELAQSIQEKTNTLETNMNDKFTTVVQKTGNRGILSGYSELSSVSSTDPIDINSPDSQLIYTTGAVTLTFTPSTENTVSFKVLQLIADGETTLTISGAKWATNQTNPTWGNIDQKLLLLAIFINQEVILSVLDNSQI